MMIIAIIRIIRIITLYNIIDKDNVKNFFSTSNKIFLCQFFVLNVMKPNIQYT